MLKKNKSLSNRPTMSRLEEPTAPLCQESGTVSTGMTRGRQVTANCQSSCYELCKISVICHILSVLTTNTPVSVFFLVLIITTSYSHAAPYTLVINSRKYRTLLSIRCLELGNGTMSLCIFGLTT